jgi:gliding motility-associated-like protein
MFRYFLLSIIYINSYSIILSQASNDGCENSIVLCFEQEQQASNISATIDTCPGCSDGSSANGNYCFALDNTVWFTFTTNNNGGDVQVDISNISCIGGATNAQTLQGLIVSASSPCDESTYNLVSNCQSGTGSDFTLVANNLAANTTYYVQIDGGDAVGALNSAECNFSISISGDGVDVGIDAGNDHYIFPSEDALLEGQGSGSYIWAPSNNLSNENTLSTIASPTTTTTYTLTITTTDACEFSDEVTVFVELPIYIPNTITPNNDGFNDFWIISNIQNYPSANVSIYDRWGQKIFNVTGYTSEKRWDGTNKGLRLPAGTYYYIIDLKAHGSSKIYNGDINIIK